jgi:hypothetical protein
MKHLGSKLSVEGKHIACKLMGGRTLGCKMHSNGKHRHPVVMPDDKDYIASDLEHSKRRIVKDGQNFMTHVPQKKPYERHHHH